jgi:ribosomal protein S17E
MDYSRNLMGIYNIRYIKTIANKLYDNYDSKLTEW